MTRIGKEYWEILGLVPIDSDLPTTSFMNEREPTFPISKPIPMAIYTTWSIKIVQVGVRDDYLYRSNPQADDSRKNKPMEARRTSDILVRERRAPV